jgi:predicted flavoprotein YhiN
MAQFKEDLDVDEPEGLRGPQIRMAREPQARSNVQREVTLGGVDTTELSSKTLEARKVSGLHFIGEVVDVTGWLGGYNFQWAWSSGYAAGQAV